MQKTDLHIIAQLRDNPKKGMTLLYNEYASSLYGVILRVCKDSSTAEDALQDSMIKIWKNIDSYNPDRSQLFTWMYAIARRTSIDYSRKVKNLPSVDISAYAYDMQLSVEMTTDTVDVKEKMDTLDKKYKEVLLGLFFEGYSQREWSKKTGLPLGTIKTRLRIAMRELRNIYLQKVISLITLLVICL